MKFIISTRHGENFDQDKIFESCSLEEAYSFLQANAAQSRLVPFNALKDDIDFKGSLNPIYGFHTQKKGDSLLYMKVFKED